MNNVIIISEGSSQVILSGLNQGLLKMFLLCHCRWIISQPLSVPFILFDLLPDVLKACHKIGFLITTLQDNDKSLFLSQSIYKLIPAPQTQSQLGCCTSETIHEQCGYQWEPGNFCNPPEHIHRALLQILCSRYSATQTPSC